MVGHPVLEENERRPTQVIALLLNPRSQTLQPRKKSHINDLKNQTVVEVSTKTILRRLREKGITWRKKSKKPYVSDKNRIARLQFARKHGALSIEQWKRVE